MTKLTRARHACLVTDWEIWACAAKLRADYGDLDGSIRAAMRADAMLEKGDVEGYGVWIRIMGCIPKLGALARDDDDTLH